jgi:hypothetical protein
MSVMAVMFQMILKADIRSQDGLDSSGTPEVHDE